MALRITNVTGCISPLLPNEIIQNVNITRVYTWLEVSGDNVPQYTQGTNFPPTDDNTRLFELDNAYLRCYLNSNNVTQYMFRFYSTAEQNAWAYVKSMYTPVYYGLLFLVNDETQRGNICYVIEIHNNSQNRNELACGNLYNGDSNLANIYSWIIRNEYNPVIYNWQSVPSISGKNGTLSLTQILNINDGEPVENVTNRGNLDFSKKTKVNTLVTDSFVPEHKEDATKALAKYEVQNKVYSYCTLVYKKGEIPSDVADGTAIQIDPDGDEVAITNLEENKTYYFVIFTNKTTSEPYRFRTGHNAPEEGIFKLKVTVDKALLDNDFKDFASYEKVT